MDQNLWPSIYRTSHEKFTCRFQRLVIHERWQPVTLCDVFFMGTRNCNTELRNIWTWPGKLRDLKSSTGSLECVPEWCVRTCWPQLQVRSNFKSSPTLILIRSVKHSSRNWRTCCNCELHGIDLLGRTTGTQIQSLGEVKFTSYVQVSSNFELKHLHKRK